MLGVEVVRLSRHSFSGWPGSSSLDRAADETVNRGLTMTTEPIAGSDGRAIDGTAAERSRDLPRDGGLSVADRPLTSPL